MSARLLSTPASCWWAALAFVAAAPRLLGHRPTRHPICETSIAIIWLGRRHATTALVLTTLAVDSAAPVLLIGGPSVPLVNGAVEGIHRSMRAGGWRRSRHRWWRRWREGVV